MIPSKLKVIGDLRKAAGKAEAVYLAGDPDREGEAICAHLREILSKPRKYEKVMAAAVEEHSANGDGEKSEQNSKPEKKETKAEADARFTPPKIYRVMFNEITPEGHQSRVRESRRRLNENLVDAQQARRVLDRLVGYKISPLLWDKVRRGLSAGRVQTVALRLIVEREREIRAFVPRNTGRSTRCWQPGEPPCIRSQADQIQGRGYRGLERRQKPSEWSPRWSALRGKWPASRRKKSAGTRRRRSPPRSCSRPPTTGCASRPSAP